LFLRFRAHEREAKKTAAAGVQRKNEHKKTKASRAKQNSANSRFSLPLPQYTGNPVLEPKNRWERENQGS
jgi:hypothetical protein